MKPVLYGIANCNTMKKARAWLDERGIDYDFHDYKKKGVDEAQLRQWVKELGWEALLNRRGMTWRRLDESLRQNIDEASAIRIMLEKPSIIKRPLLDLGGRKLLGFDEQAWAEALNP
jgi:Spx/MgsR family transcriptional regulator